MQKAIFYIIIITAYLLVAPLFVTATTYTQLAVATLFYALLVFFSIRYSPRKKLKVRPQIPEVAIEPVPVSVDKLETETTEIIDTNKRDFLKMIVAAGFSFFFFSILSKKAEALLFGKAIGSGAVVLADPTGNKIYPVEKQPTDGYQISDIDESDYIYCGYINKNGGWYIMRQDSETGTFRYVKGESNFSHNWGNRERLKYNYFHQVFSI